METATAESCLRESDIRQLQVCCLFVSRRKLAPACILDAIGSPSGSISGSQQILAVQLMGFSNAKAKEALEECDNDVDAAIEWLVVNCI